MDCSDDMLSVSKVWLAVSMDERMNPVYRYVKPQYTNERKINKSSADTGVVLEIPDYGCECDLYKKYVGSLFDYDLVLVRPAIYVKHPSPTNVTSAGTIVVQSSVYNKYITTEPYRRFTGNVHTFDDIIYRWNKAPVDDYVCVGYDKHYKEFYQYSYDGENWYDVAPISSRTSSDVIEYNSVDCGYIQPPKYLATYSDSHISSAQCGSIHTIGYGEINTTNLVSVEIGNCVSSLDDYVFSGGRSLTSCTLPDSVTSIGKYAFRNCSGLTSIDIPSGITRINQNVFDGCRSLTSLTIPSGVTSVGERAFSGCRSLTSLTIPSGVTSIGASAFYECSSLTSVNIPSGITSIGEYTFQYCSSITSIDIPNSVTIISGQAFYNCSGLTSLTIPSGVTSIGESAFRDCSGLTSITVNATTPPDLGNYAFNGSSCQIYVPSGTASYYRSSWRAYSDRIQEIP